MFGLESGVSCMVRKLVMSEETSSSPFALCCWMTEIDKYTPRNPNCSVLGLLFAYVGALARLAMEKIRNKFRSLLCSRGCLGRYPKPELASALDDPTKGKGRIVEGRGGVKKTSISDDFWSTTSTHEIDNNSAIQSQRSMSSMSTSNQNADPQSATGSSSNPSEFVNHGLLLWNQIRQEWVGDRKNRNQPRKREPTLSWNATYENLLGTSKPFPQPIPLPEMVEFLVDVWEQEGLYG